MLDALAFKAISYALIGILALTCLILSVVSLRIEIISASPLNGLFPFVLIIVGFCVLIALATAYVQAQRATSTMLRWERAALTPKK
jgi:hypothetical protein